MSVLLASLLALLAPALRVAALDVLQPPARGERYGEYTCLTGACAVPPEYVLTNATTLNVVRRVATGGRHPTVIFTTLRFGDPADPRTAPVEGVLGMLSNFCHWLHRAGRLQNTMLITTDERTWTELYERGLPAYLDRAFPRRGSYVERVRPLDTWNREFDVQKHWWGWRLASLGFRVLYMDSDAAVLRDPLEPFEQPYDVQGLSDWLEPDVPTGDSLSLMCPGASRDSLYAMVAEPRVPQGAMLREEFNMEPDVWRLRLRTPCQSTGVWYLQPTPAAVAFTRAVVERIAYHAVYQWDQTAWNEIIMAFLVVAGGDEAPLRYRLLPHSQYSNIGVYRERKARAMPVDQVVLHLGFIPGWDKEHLYREEGLFHPEFRRAPRELQAPASSALAGWLDRLSSGSIATLLMVPLAATTGLYVGRLSRRRSKG